MLLPIAELPGDFPDLGHRALVEGAARSDRERSKGSPDAPPGNRPIPQVLLARLLHGIAIGLRSETLEEAGGARDLQDGL
jgi:hypothetical protein